MNTATAPAWRLDFDGAELAWARAVPGGWLLRFAAVPARPLPATAGSDAEVGHALGVELHLAAFADGARGEAPAPCGAAPGAAPTAVATPQAPPQAAALAQLLGRCSGLQCWAGAGPSEPPPPFDTGGAPLPPLTLPGQHAGPVRLRLQMAQGGELVLQGHGLRLLQPEGPRWVAHLHC